ARGELVQLLRERELLRVRARRALVERREGDHVVLLVALAVDAHDRERVAGDQARQHLALHDARDLGLLIAVGARYVYQHGYGLRPVARVRAAGQDERGGAREREKPRVQGDVLGSRSARSMRSGMLM